MRLNSKSLLLVLAGMAAILLLVWGSIWIHCRYLMNINNAASMNLSGKDKQSAMQAMLGAKNPSTLPLKTASDQKPLEPIMMNGAKHFTTTAEPVSWEYRKDTTITARAFNGQVPGPEIRVTEGDRVMITFNNKLPEATTIHWHGLDVPNALDGVPGITQAAIQRGKSFAYEFTATPAGTRFYHTQGSGMSDEAQQSDAGLSGTFIVEPKGYQKPDKEYIVVLDDWRKDSSGFNLAAADMNMDGIDMEGM